MDSTTARLDKVSHYYGAQAIVENISREIYHDARIGFLPQEVRFDLDRTLLEEARTASPTLASLEAEIDHFAFQMGDPAMYGDYAKLGRLTAR